MIIDGVTWACETCIRGHRAANCQHIERPLQPLGRKGRPVSQCHHCRSLRHSRSLHTRCKCELMARNGASEGNGKRCKCRCMEGEACTCAFKKSQIANSTVSEKSSEDNKSSGLLQPPDSCHEDPTVVKNQLQYLPGSSGYSQEIGLVGVRDPASTGSFSSPEGWDSTPVPVIKSPTVPSTAISVEGTDWESPWEAYPSIEPPYGGTMPEDQLSLELSTLMDAFIEESAMEGGTNIHQDGRPERLNLDLP
ncbi:hypothetical protein TWF173_011059 [Orbilia oligospora]|nr:hypothetical protein TWF173_011059 [Orbilia oligospora]